MNNQSAFCLVAVILFLSLAADGYAMPEVEITPENIEHGKNLLDLAVVAAGGLEALKGISSIERKGKMTFGTDYPLSLTITSLEEFPDKYRQEVSGMGRTFVTIRDGSGGWKIPPQSGELVDMSAEEIAESDKERARNLVNILSHADDPYYQAVYGGRGNLDGAIVDWVAIIDLEGETICHLGLNVNDHSLVGRKYRSEDFKGKGILEETMFDFREIHGVQIPMVTIGSMDDGKLWQLDLSECIIDGEVAHGAFDTSDAAPSGLSQYSMPGSSTSGNRQEFIERRGDRITHTTQWSFKGVDMSGGPGEATLDEPSPEAIKCTQISNGTFSIIPRITIKGGETKLRYEADSEGGIINWKIEGSDVEISVAFDFVDSTHADKAIVAVELASEHGTVIPGSRLMRDGADRFSRTITYELWKEKLMLRIEGAGGVFPLVPIN